MNLEKDFLKAMNEFKENHSSIDFTQESAYADWLAQTYFFVRHSTALLGYSLPHLKNDALRHHFEHHLGEETRHDLLCIKDLERMGMRISDFTEYSCTQAFYQSQYYRIAFEGGTSLLGYILFLEGLAVHWGKELHESIKDLYKGSILFLKVHAEEDPQHLQDAIQTIMKLPLPEQEVILKNFHYSMEMYGKILQTIDKPKVLKLVA